MINMLISIPVHEKTEVVIDQIVNYKYFCPDCGIVLHISRGFNFNDSFHNEKEFLFILNTFENVFVNPTRLDTGFADIVHTHVSNFDYVSNFVDFKYFAMGASNDLFVRSMPEIKDCDLSCSNVISSETWYWHNHMIHDSYLKQILQYFDSEQIMQSQIEGSIYSKKLFKSISDVINEFYNYDEVKNQQRVIYPREEVYYPTIAYIIDKNLNNKKLNYTFVAWKNPNLMPKPEEIIDIAKGEMLEKYSIKRVNRNFNDFIRFQIATQIGNYRNESIERIKIKFTKQSRKYFNLVSNRRRIFVDLQQNENKIRSMFKIKTNEIFYGFKIIDSKINLVELIDLMEINSDALFIFTINNYPEIINFLSQHNFREGIDFIDGTMLMD